MKKHFYISLFTFFLLSSFSTESQEKGIVIDSKYSYAEKIYLQLSNTVFTTDNTVWLKAIVTDLAHLPTKLSGVLYVELIDFDERIVDKKLLKIEKGIADGFFQLSEGMAPGRYMVRAYTEWNKNFGNAFISQTYIDIYVPKKILKNEEPIRNITLTEITPNQFELTAIAYPQLVNSKHKGKVKMYIHTGTKADSVEIIKDKEGEYRLKHKLPKDVIKARIELKLESEKLIKNNLNFLSSYSKTVAVDKDYLDLQFFPEGGKLVDGLTSIIGIKALNYNNKGNMVAGYIVDQDNNKIIPFRSNTLGMGVTYLTPNVNTKYYGSIKNEAGIEFKYELPKVNQTGVVLKVKELQDYIVITINTNDFNQEEFHVKVQVRGLEYNNFMLPLKEGVAKTGIEKSTLPEGIIKFTITNKANQIVSERLFFNYREDERINITATPHLKHYSQRDKTVFNLATKDKDSNAIKTNLSVVVINKEQLGALNTARSNILSYFLLNSELRGTIENPSYYFNTKNMSRKYDMDALLLTQGWSNYKYENSTLAKDFKIFPETSLSVLGTVRNLLSPRKSLRKPIDVTLVYGPLNVMTQQVGSTGRFNFQMEDFYKENLKVIIQTKTEKEKKKDFTIDLDGYKSPKVDYLREENIQLADSMHTYVAQNIARKQAEENFKVADGTIALDEVLLEGYNLTPARQKMMNLYGPPDLVIENEELVSNVERWHWGLYSLLQSRYPNDIEIETKYDPEGIPLYQEATVYGADRTIILIDGKIVKFYDYPSLESLPTEEIKSFEIIKNPKRRGFFEDQDFDYASLGIDEEFTPLNKAGKTSIISIYSYAGKGFYGIQSAIGIYRGYVSGFSPKTEFFAPKHENLTTQDWNLPDLRSVVHWAPNIDTDEEGNAQIEFYNADNTGDMLVIVEGITENGKIGYYETTYTVKEKLEK